MVDRDKRQTCDMCGEPVGELSIDLWAMVTLYTEHGDVAKTCEELDPDVMKQDYLVIGVCCMDKAIVHWNGMVRNILGGKK